MENKSPKGAPVSINSGINPGLKVQGILNTNKIRQNSQTVLITRASLGIGYELSKLFAQNDFNLVLIARNEDKLNQIAAGFRENNHIQVKVIAKDLSIATAPEEIFSELTISGINVDIVVNNAGLGVYGLFANTNLQEELNMLQVNITALVHLTKLFLPGMLSRNSGKILNVASTAAFQPGPLMSLYYASKAFVLSFSEAIANEVKGTGVSVTVLCPGLTISNFHKSANMGHSKMLKNPLLKFMDAETVAKAGYKATMKGKTIEVPGLLNYIQTSLIKFFPRFLVTKVVRIIQEGG